MGKLDITYFRYLTPEDFRALTSVEMGMKNHEIVPINLIASIAKIRSGNCFKILKNLCKEKLLIYEKDKNFEGYYLTYKGYDFLAVRVFIKQDIISYFGSQIGVGKESDVFVVSNEEGKKFAMKIHRLGRNSFRKLKEKRDYHKNRRTISWLYLSRLAATKEFLFMQALYSRNFPVPKPIAHNRHCIIMQLLSNYVPLNDLIIEKSDVEAQSISISKLYERLMDLISKMALCGVIHCDFNEFNLLFNPNDLSDVVMIDFPQIVSIHHPNARELFERDVLGVVMFFNKKFGLNFEEYPCFDDVYQEFLKKSEEDLSDNHNPNVENYVGKSNLKNTTLVEEVNAQIKKDLPISTTLEASTSLLDRFLNDTLISQHLEPEDDTTFDADEEESDAITEEPIFEISKKFDKLLQRSNCSGEPAQDLSLQIKDSHQQNEILEQMRYTLCLSGKDKIIINEPPGKTNQNCPEPEPVCINDQLLLEELLSEAPPSTQLSTVFDISQVRAKVKQQSCKKQITSYRSNLNKLPAKGQQKAVRERHSNVKEDRFDLQAS